MKTLTILVDMDDTLVGLSEVWVDYLNKKYGTDVCRKDIKEWDMRKSFPSLTGNQIYKPLTEDELWKRVKPLPGAVEYVMKLIKEGHKVVVVTSASPDTVKAKLCHCLFKYFPFTYKDVVVAHQKQLVKGDVLIDDAVHNVEGGDYLGILIDAPHNESYDAESNGVVRVKSWEEIYNIIGYLREYM